LTLSPEIRQTAAGKSVPPKGARSLILPGIVTLVAVAILVSLGNWQVRRLAYKTALAAHVTERLKAAPTPLPDRAAWATIDSEAADYTPVKLTGHFVLSREFHVFTTLGEPKGKLGGVGWFIFTPFIDDAGNEVLINRGFVPDGNQDPAIRADGLTEAPRTITGLLRRPEGSNPFTPANDIAGNRWFTRDPVAMAKQLGIAPDRTLPFYIDLEARFTPTGGLPQAGETVIDFSNNHLGYAITWYGLALTAIGVFGAFAWGRLRRQARPG
jgi:surfeit locus 1 family protein